MASSNPKAQAWEAVGLKYYSLGRRSGKPTHGTVRWFTGELGAGSRCLVVGGTSVAVVRAALRSGCDLLVVDFSERVCRELREWVPAAVPILNRDVLEPWPEVEGSFTHVLCDALLNRFDGPEARRFERRVASLLAPGGVLRATVKLGHYPMDLRLLEIAGGSGAPFWDERTRTIDYSRIGDLLERGYARHGGISRRDLLGWYRHRGREKRFQESDLRELFAPPAWDRVDVDPEAPGSDRVRLSARLAGP
jgi:hypothetical protein